MTIPNVNSASGRLLSADTSAWEASPSLLDGDCARLLLLLLHDHLLHLALLLLGLCPNTKRFREVPPLNLIRTTAFSS